MKIKQLLLPLIGLTFSSSVFAWGQTGHRVTGEIASLYLSPAAQQQLQVIIPDSSLAEVSTYPDEMRSDPSKFWKKTASPWHYVSVPKGKEYAEVGAPEQGDAVTALAHYTKVLKDAKASQEDKHLALSFIVHIIGDLHQPLHAGNGTDRGGNDVKLKFFWEDSNLHRVWDSGMLDKEQLSFTEWANWLSQKISKQQQQKWQQTDPQVWIAESTEIRDKIYPQEKEISWDYKYQHLPIAKKRLQQAGVRIASYLNQVFAK